MKNVIITGASKGLGLQVAKTLLLHGYAITAIGRTVTPELSQLKRKHKSRIAVIQYDLANTEAIQKEVFQKGIGFDKPVYALINNAALAYDDIVTNAKTDMLERMFRVNVLSPMILCKYAIRHMLLHGTRGRIVHVSSVCAHTGYKGLSMYAATKGALEAFSKNIAREWGEKGIRSNCVVPGFMETEMTSGLDKAQRERIYSRTALKQPTSPVSVAETIRFLLSDDATSVTGQNFVVDSGTI